VLQQVRRGRPTEPVHLTTLAQHDPLILSTTVSYVQKIGTKSCMTSVCPSA
jgi:hypothetical protein